MKRFNTTQFIHVDRAVFSLSVPLKTLTLRSLGTSQKLSRSSGCLGQRQLWVDECSGSLCTACPWCTFFMLFVEKLSPAQLITVNKFWFFFHVWFWGRCKQNENIALKVALKGSDRNLRVKQSTVANYWNGLTQHNLYTSKEQSFLFLYHQKLWLSVHLARHKSCQSQVGV